jgi:hypothetical protein
MKKAELELGKVYAYSTRKDPDRMYQVSAIAITDLDPKLNWADTKGSVQGNYIKSNGEVGATAKFLPRYIIGDYAQIKHQFEIDEKNREIAQLKKTIETKKAEETIARYKDIFTNEETYKVHSYYIKNMYNGNVSIELTNDQFASIAIDLKSLARYRAEEEAKRQAEWEARQADLNIIKEEQVA